MRPHLDYSDITYNQAIDSFDKKIGNCSIQ